MELTSIVVIIVTVLGAIAQLTISRSRASKISAEAERIMSQARKTDAEVETINTGNVTKLTMQVNTLLSSSLDLRAKVDEQAEMLAVQNREITDIKVTREAERRKSLASIKRLQTQVESEAKEREQSQAALMLQLKENGELKSQVETLQKSVDNLTMRVNALKYERDELSSILSTMMQMLFSNGGAKRILSREEAQEISTLSKKLIKIKGEKKDEQDN